VIVHYKEPLGDDPGVTDILIRKLKEADCSGNTGVMLFAHGSPLRYNRELADRISGRLRNSGIGNVFRGFNEYNEPSIEDSYAAMLDAGFDKIIMLPMFLASGAHISEEIPEKLGIPAGGRGGTVTKGGRDIIVTYVEPLGLDLGINDVLVRKIESSTSS
jgi:sirohydrochlorin cobaltochelatase